MKDGESASYMNIQIRDALYKSELYFTKILRTSGSIGQIQKICHLAAESSLKFLDNPDFSQAIYPRLRSLILQSKSYFLLYLLDILIKNSILIMRLAKDSLGEIFKAVWTQIWLESKNGGKLECLKAIARTWQIIYGVDRVDVEGWLRQVYGATLALEKKHEELYIEAYQKYRPPPPQPKAQPRIQGEHSKSDSDRRPNTNIKIPPFEIRLEIKHQEQEERAR